MKVTISPNLGLHNHTQGAQPTHPFSSRAPALSGKLKSSRGGDGGGDGGGG